MLDKIAEFWSAPRFFTMEDGEYRIQLGAPVETRVHLFFDGHCVKECRGHFDRAEEWALGSYGCSTCRRDEDDGPFVAFRCVVYRLEPDDALAGASVVYFDSGHYRVISDLAISLRKEDLDVRSFALDLVLKAPSLEVRVASGAHEIQEPLRLLTLEDRGRYGTEFFCSNHDGLMRMDQDGPSLGSLTCICSEPFSVEWLVVGCTSRCRRHWLIADGADRRECPQCGKPLYLVGFWNGPSSWKRAT